MNKNSMLRSEHHRGRTLHVPFVEQPTGKFSIVDERFFGFNELPFHSIDQINWVEYPYAPLVKFRLAYSLQSLLIQFKVEEKTVRATCQAGDEHCLPSDDSCVEFFIRPSDSRSYYNFEFSCNGYCLIMHGEDRTNRTRLTQKQSTAVQVHSSLGTASFGERLGAFDWTLTADIPLSLFIGEEYHNLNGQKLRANFYKCGDQLSNKHYLSWSPITSPEPDFHRPEQFGFLEFE